MRKPSKKIITKPIEIEEPVLKEKSVELEVINHNPSKFIQPALSFMGSSIIMIGFVFGIYWYGGQLSKTISTLLRAPLAIKSSSYSANTIYYDPLDLLEEVNKKDSNIIFLDIRSDMEYKKAHVKKAVSIPFYSIENNKIKYTDIQETAKKITIDKSKFIVLYGPSTSFQRQQLILAQIKKMGYSSQLLAVGWNELRHFQNFWLPEPLWGKLAPSVFVDEGI